MTTLTLCDELALLGFSNDPAHGLTAGKLRDVLKPVLQKSRLGFPEALPRLAALSMIEKMAPAPRQRAERWRLAAPGRQALAARLGAETSARPRGWLLKAGRALIAARGLGLDPRLAAVLAAQQQALATFHLARKLGVAFAPGMTAPGLARELAAAELGTPNARPSTLWGGLLEHALSMEHAAPPNAAASRPPDPEPFHSQTRRAARLATEGWFGPNKLFIHRAWEAWRREPGQSLDLAGFKSRLLAALRDGQLGLTRADFTATLDPDDLAQSEIRDGSECFHFLTIDPETP